VRRRAPTQPAGGTGCELMAGGDEPETLRRLLWPLIELPIDGAIAALAGVTRSLVCLVRCD
jgi:hypothetical protein